jgi:hypothetical protein
MYSGAFSSYLPRTNSMNDMLSLRLTMSALTLSMDAAGS